MDLIFFLKFAFTALISFVFSISKYQSKIISVGFHFTVIILHFTVWLMSYITELNSVNFITLTNHTYSSCSWLPLEKNNIKCAHILSRADFQS